MYRFRFVFGSCVTWIALSSLLICARIAHAQQPDAERGLPSVVLHDTEALGAHVQSRGSASDGRGVRYVANGDGLLEYDGTAWRMLRIGDIAAVFAVAADARGVVYFGAENDLGYLVVDPEGETQITSLAEDLIEAYPDVLRDDAFFTRQVIATPSGVVFRVDDALFRWQEGTFERLVESVRVDWVAHAKTRLLAGTSSGIVDAHTGEQVLPANGQPVAHQNDPDGSLLFFGASQVWRYDGRQRALVFDADAQKVGSIRKATLLRDGSLALGTADGVALVSAEGRLAGRLMEGEDVAALDTSSDGLLWICVPGGVAIVDPLAAITRFGEEQGLEGLVETTTRHRGRIYVGTTSGVYGMDVSGGVGRFERVPGFSGEVFDLYVAGGQLLAATGAGLYQVGDARVTRLGDSERTVMALSSWPDDSLRVLYAGVDGAVARR